jgi:hypothetical protein
MTKQIKWKFKGLDLYFVSPADKLELHQTRQRAKLGLKTKIEIIDDNFITDTSPDGCASCKRNSAVDTQPALSVVSDQTEPQPEADELLGMFFDVDPTGTAADLLSDSPSTSDADSTSDGVAGEPA